MNLYRYLLAEDIFIAYARLDGYRYAEACASRLSKAGYFCAFDQWTSRPGTNPPKELLRALKRSCVLVVVGSPGTAVSDNVKDEVKIFSDFQRPIVPISFEGSLEQAGWFHLLRGGPIEMETKDALRTARPCKPVLRRIKNAATHRIRSQRQTFVAAVTLAVVIISLIAGGFWLNHEARLAQEARNSAAAEKLAAAEAVSRRNQADLDARSTEIAMAALQPPTVENGLESSLQALAISPTDAAKKSLLQNLASVSHLRSRVLCPADEEPESAFFSKDNHRVALLCSRTMLVVSLPSMKVIGHDSALNGLQFTSSAVQFLENQGRIYAFETIVYPKEQKEQVEFVAWPLSHNAKFPESNVEKSRGAMTVASWQRSARAELLKNIEEENCQRSYSKLVAVNEQASWAACTNSQNVVLLFPVDNQWLKEELRGHTEGPLGRRVNSVNLIAFDRSQETRFVITGGELRGGRSGFLVWDLQQLHPVSQTVRAIDGDPQGGAPALVLARSNSVVACSGCASTVEIIDLQTGKATPIQLPSFSTASTSPSGNVVFFEGPGGLWRLPMQTPYRPERLAATGSLGSLTAASDDRVIAIEDYSKLLSWSPAGVIRADLNRMLPGKPQPPPLTGTFTCTDLGEDGKALFAEVYTKGQTDYSLFIAELSENLAVKRSKLIPIPDQAGACAQLAVAQGSPILLRTALAPPVGTVAVTVLENYWNADAKFNPIEDSEGGSFVISRDGKTAFGGLAMLDLVQKRSLVFMHEAAFPPPPPFAVALASDGSFFISAANPRQRLYGGHPEAVRKWSLDYRDWQRRTESIFGRTESIPGR